MNVNYYKGSLTLVFEYPGPEFRPNSSPESRTNYFTNRKLIAKAVGFALPFEKTKSDAKARSLGTPASIYGRL